MNDIEDDIGEYANDQTPANMEGFPLAPPGWYPTMIIAGEKKETKAGSNFYLNLMIQIVEGDYKGTNWFHMLNLWNSNEKSVQIAKAQLNCYKRAVGKPGAKSSKELMNIAFRCSVGIQTGQQGYKDKNYTKDAEPYAAVPSSIQRVQPIVVVGNQVQVPLADDEVPSFQ